MAVGAEYGNLKVDTAELKLKAEEAHKNIQKYREALNNISTAVKASESFWVGEAGDLYRSILETQMELIKEAFEIYSEYPKDLLEFAGIYSEVILETTNKAEEIESFKMS